VLVVVRGVADVAVVAVDEVEVVAVRDGRVAAPVHVDVHVAVVRDVRRIRWSAIVHVVVMGMVDVPVVQEVHVVVMGHDRVTTEAIVLVRVPVVGRMDVVIGHGWLPVCHTQVNEPARHPVR
jgi:hypothetical protein